MTPLPSETTLVIAGAWNPAILSPEWFMRHGLGLALPAQGEAGPRVQAAVPTGMGLVFDMPRFTIEGITYVARPDALVLAPETNAAAALDRLQEVARGVLSQLRHTPIGGYGQNFEFKDAEPDPDLLGAFTAANEPLAQNTLGWEVDRTALATSYRSGNRIVNITRQYSAQSNELTVKFNFHYAASSVAACLELVAEAHSMAANYRTARDMVAEVYGGVADEN